MNVRVYWAQHAVELAKLQEAHPVGCVFLTSLDDSEHNTTAGTVAEVRNYEAAGFLVKKSHRISTASEIAAHRETERQNLIFSEAMTRKAHQTYNTADPATIAASVAIAIRTIAAEQEAESDARYRAKQAQDQHPLPTAPGPINPPVKK
jgi:hypothetical protein